MAARELARLVAAANAHLADPARNRVVGPVGGSPRFELYHFALSLGAQQVRAVLAEKEIPYHAHEVGILPPVMAHYQPDYVRLRLAANGHGRLVDGYTGRTALASEGFDPCVVPTLVDHESGRVLTDSQAMLEHLDQTGDGPELIPGRHRREVLRQMAIVAATPHDALLHGAHTDGDCRPQFLQEQMPGIHDYRIMRLMEARSLAVGEPDLIAAYDAKIRKEAAARAFIREPELMRGVAREVDGLIGALESALEHGEDWLLGGRFTLADLVWAVSLFRLQWLGMAFLWTGGDPRGSRRPRVAAYAGRLFARPAIRTAVIEWPGTPPSEHVATLTAAMNGGDQRPTAGNRAGRDGAAGNGALRSTRDIRENRLTEAVLSTLAATPNPRHKKLFGALARHLHAFIEEVEPTEQEWLAAIGFLTRTGQISDDKRQEFILLSDVLGATARVDLINHRFPAGATENSVLGPFFMAQRPLCANGDDISGGQRGEPLAFSGRVLDTEGRPVSGARVDIWHSDGIGAYDVMMPGLTEAAMRGLFRADAEGRFWFTSIVPTSYPIPMDGPVGELMRATGRSPVRPAHVHVRIEAPGFALLTTMLFVAGDANLDSDPVFGVKSSLIVPFRPRPGWRLPDGAPVAEGSQVVEHDFVLAKRR